MWWEGVSWHACGQKTTCTNQFSPSTMWGLGIELSSGLVAGASTWWTVFLLSHLGAHACPFFSWVLGCRHSGSYAFKANTSLTELSVVPPPLSPSLSKSAVKRHWETFIKIHDEISFSLIIIHNFIKGSYLVKTVLSDWGWVGPLSVKSSHNWS